MLGFGASCNNGSGRVGAKRGPPVGFFPLARNAYTKARGSLLPAVSIPSWMSRRSIDIVGLGSPWARPIVCEKHGKHLAASRCSF